MAWNFYLNLESIALKSARDAADMMTDDNRYPDLPDYYDAEAFTNNLQHGRESDSWNLFYTGIHSELH